MLWFTSDWHLDHTNILKLSHRPFADIKEMNTTILNNVFNTVKNGDTLFHLGDLTYYERSFTAFTDQFDAEYGDKVKFVMIEGNHDDRIKHKIKQWASRYYQRYVVYWNSTPVTLCHYFMGSYLHSHTNAWHLFGHHHNNPMNIYIGKQMNVGVDVCNFMPVSMKQVATYMAARPNNWDYVEPRKK